MAAVDLSDLFQGHAGVVVIPPEGAELTEPLTVDANVVIDVSSGVLTISGNGELVIEAPTEIFGGKIVWRKTIGNSAVALRVVEGGGLDLHDAEVALDVTFASPNAFGGPPAWFIRTAVTGAGGILRIEGNNVVAERFYTVGFLYGDVAGFTCVAVRNNRFSNAHGGVAIIGGAGARIEDNTLLRVTHGAIVTSGAFDYRITGNAVIHPGWGGPGDGMTLIGGGGGAVKRNSVAHGSCYGIQLLPLAGQGHVEGTVIEDNSISNGATSAIYIEGYSPSDGFDGLLIRGNTLAGNLGRGLYSKYATDITVEDNLFQGNANGLPQHFFDVGSQYERWAYNKIGVPFSGGWTAGAYQPPYVDYAWPGYN